MAGFDMTWALVETYPLGVHHGGGTIVGDAGCQAAARYTGSRRWLTPRRGLGTVALLSLTLAACQPTVKIEAPDEPIVINLNVKIEQEVRVRIEREIDDLLRENDDLF